MYGGERVSIIYRHRHLIPILSLSSYRNNVIALRSLMHDQPQTALDRAVWWTEHVLRHGGGKHLRSPSANMPWSEYLALDLVLVFLALALAFVTVIVFIVIYLIRNLQVFIYGKIKQS